MGNTILDEKIEKTCADPANNCNKTDQAENICNKTAEPANSFKTVSFFRKYKMAVRQRNDGYRPDFWTNCRCFFESHDPGRVLAKERMRRRKREGSSVVRSFVEEGEEEIGSNGDSSTCQKPSKTSKTSVGLPEETSQPTEEASLPTAAPSTPMSCGIQCSIDNEITECPPSAGDDTTSQNKSRRVSWKIKRHKRSKSKKLKNPTETEENKECESSLSTSADPSPELVCARLSTCPIDDADQPEVIRRGRLGKKTRWKKWKTSMDNPISVIHEETFGPGPEEVAECQPICEVHEDVYSQDDNGLNSGSNENDTNLPEGSGISSRTKRSRRKILQLPLKNSDRKPKKRHFWGKKEQNQECVSTPPENNSLDETDVPIPEDNSEVDSSVKRNRRKRRNRMAEACERKPNRDSFWKKNFLSCTKKDDCASDTGESSSSYGTSYIDGGHNSIIVTCKPARLQTGDSQVSLSQSLEPNQRDDRYIEGY